MPHPKLQNWLDRISSADLGRRGARSVIVERRQAGLTWEGTTRSARELELSAGLDENTYALARMVSSEVNLATKPPEYGLAVAECARNESRSWRDGSRTLAYMLKYRTTRAYTWTDGYYGIQKGRWASTKQDPTERDVAVAQVVIGGSRFLPAGARRFFDPRVQDGGRQGSTKLRKDAVDVIHQWGSEGWRWIGPLPNVDSYRLMVLEQERRRPLQEHEMAPALAVIRRGRSGESTIPSIDSPTDDERMVAQTGLPLWVAGVVAVIL